MNIDLFAAAALIISLVSLALSIEARLVDRHRLACNALMSTTYGKGQETYCIEVVVTNLGRRPVSVVNVSYDDHHEDLSPGAFAVRSPIHGGLVDKGGPIDLAENQTRSFSTPQLTRSDLLRRTKRIDVVVRDSRGKIYTNTIDNDAYMGKEIETMAANLGDEA